MKAKTSYKKFWLPLVLLLLIGINRLASAWHTRIDLTDEKRFTLSNPTKKLLHKLDAPVTVQVFLKENLNSGFRQLTSSTNDLLQEFKEIAGNKLQIETVSPDEVLPGTQVSYADTLTALGFYPIDLTSRVKEGQQQQYVYPYALVHYKDAILPVELYKGKTPLISFSELNSAEALLEYRFAEAIAKISESEKTQVGYLTGNGEPVDFRTYDLAENFLGNEYKLFTFDVNAPKFIPQEFKALIVVKPTVAFTDEAKLKLDQYVMNGGKLIMLIDRLNAETDSLQLKNQVTAFDRDLRLNDLLFNYGVRINADLVKDLQCDYLKVVNANNQDTTLSWSYYPVMESPGKNPIGKGVGFVLGRFVNSLDTIEAEGIKKTVILQSSSNAQTVGSPAIIDITEIQHEPDPAKFTKADIPTGVLLEGKFTSLFANRLSQVMKDSLQSYNLPFVSQNEKANKMIVIGDGDIVLNDATRDGMLPMGVNKNTLNTPRSFQFANKEFLKNCLGYLIDENGLNEAKAKDFTPKLLDPKKTASQKTFWQTMNIALPILVILLFAVVFQWLRKRKYTRRS